MSFESAQNLGLSRFNQGLKFSWLIFVCKVRPKFYPESAKVTSCLQRCLRYFFGALSIKIFVSSLFFEFQVQQFTLGICFFFQSSFSELVNQLHEQISSTYYFGLCRRKSTSIQLLLCPWKRKFTSLRLSEKNMKTK